MVAIKKEHHIVSAQSPRRLPRQAVHWLPKPLGKPMAYVLADDLGRHILGVLATVEHDFSADVPAHPIEEPKLVANKRSLGAVIKDAWDRRQLGEIHDPQRLRW